MTRTQVWRLGVDGHEHRIEADLGSSRLLRWYVDDALVTERTSRSEKVGLTSAAGKVRLRFGTLGGPQRATLLNETDGLDLVPDPGSPAAAYEEKLRAHPERYSAIQTLAGAARVVIPIVLTSLLARFALSLDLPALPLPDLPSLPRPDLPSWSPPGWVQRALEIAHYVWTVVLAFVIARAEVRRRRRQDQTRRRQDG
ncbi:hypothetical protein [Nocardioides sp. URHA0020]|uniref:hypothetical protein n=1 Tax=Nocardioides sp. URHA0020 TaxID=1380392 RepID=UPI00048C9633|nr:hypothetical protein [Nocardioides sp. URHA0020]